MEKRFIVVKTDRELIMRLETCGVVRLTQVNSTTYKYIDVWDDVRTFKVKKGSEVTLED